MPSYEDGGDILSNKLAVSEGDILVNKLNVRFKRIWKTDKLPANSVCSTGFVPMRAEKVDRDYLYYLLLDDRFTETMSTMRSGTSSSHQRVKIEWMLDYEIELPDEDTQHKVAAILTSIDDGTENLTRTNRHLLECARVIFDEIQRDCGSEAFIGDLADLNPETYSLREGWAEVSYLDTGAISKGRIDATQHINTVEDKLPSRARRKVRAGDIVYSTVRPNQEHYGIIAFPEDHMLVSTGFTVVRVKDERVTSELVYLSLTQPSTIEYLQQIGEQSTSAYPSVKADDIAKLIIGIPQGGRAVGMLNDLATMFHGIASNELSSAHLIELRDALLPKLMSGEIDVSEVKLS